VSPAAVDANGNTAQMIFSQRLIPLSKLLVGDLTPGIWITPAFTGVDDYIAHILIIDLSTRKDDR
jgi:hypothetical protein